MILYTHQILPESRPSPLIVIVSIGMFTAKYLLVYKMSNFGFLCTWLLPRSALWMFIQLLSENNKRSICLERVGSWYSIFCTLHEKRNIGIMIAHGHSIIILETKVWINCDVSVMRQQKIIIPNTNGEKLVGILHETGSVEIVIVCHGFRSTKVSNRVEWSTAVNRWSCRIASWNSSHWLIWLLL